MRAIVLGFDARCVRRRAGARRTQCDPVFVLSGGPSQLEHEGQQRQGSVRPKHGTLSARAGGGVAYKTPAGYKGEDSFVFTVTGQMHTGNGTATIRISVNVI